MPITVSVSEKVFGRVSGLRLVIVSARNIASLAHRHLSVSTFWRDAWQKVFALGVHPAEQPHIQAYRSVLKTAGAKIEDYPPALEAIYRRACKSRACKSPLPFSVCRMVDFYNACTFNHAMSVAGFNIDRLDTALELAVFGGGETFRGLGRGAPETVSAGEIGYRSGGALLSCYFMWRQSRNAALNNHTSKLLLITEAVQGVSQDGANFYGQHAKRRCDSLVRHRPAGHSA